MQPDSLKTARIYIHNLDGSSSPEIVNLELWGNRPSQVDLPSYIHFIASLPPSPLSNLTDDNNTLYEWWHNDKKISIEVPNSSNPSSIYFIKVFPSNNSEISTVDGFIHTSYQFHLLLYWLHQ